MRNISERDLAVVISLVNNKIRQMHEELHATEDDVQNLSDDEYDERYALQESVEQYTVILDNLRHEYEAALAQGIVLPSYEELTAYR